MLDIKLKKEKADIVAEYRKQLQKSPQLKYLFLELTSHCNEHCLHCGSRCGEFEYDELTFDDYKHILDTVKEDFDIRRMMLCITGGEPLLRLDFFEIMNYAKSLGFTWGMTSNGTLIDDDVTQKLYYAGMGTIALSIDGLPEYHDAFRQTPGGFDAAMKGLHSLVNFGKFKDIMVTTVVTHQNIDQLDDMYEIFKNIDIDTWRVINMEPMGRAKDYPDMLLTKDDYIRLFEFIRNKRIANENVVYGCGHYLGEEYEGELRDWFYMCIAGTQVASIASNGDILACLDIERRPELVQGNIKIDRFGDVWKNKFDFYRRDLGSECAACQKCESYKYCLGDSVHSWDFENHKPGLCMKGICF